MIAAVRRSAAAERDHRRDGAPLHRHERGQHGDAGDDQPAGVEVDPAGQGARGVRVGADAEPDEDQADGGGQQPDAGKVERSSAAFVAAYRGRQRERHNSERGDADRQVHGEHRTPADVVGEEAADQRAGDEATPISPASAPWSAALRRPAKRSATRMNDRPSSAPAPSPWTERNAISCVMSWAVAAKRGTDQEHRHADEQHRAPAVAVGQPRVDRQRHRRGHQVGGHHPDVERRAVEVFDYPSASRCRRSSGRAWRAAGRT